MRTIAGWFILLAACLSWNMAALAEEVQQKPRTGGRTKTIDFDEEIIEGMNKNPFDTLTSIGKRDGAAQKRLYRLKTDFRRDIQQTVLEMGQTQ